ncbi:MAG: hypothetical protein Q8S73_01720 [Deltaproteobacteria bacterium]|nr:hypothetical protein [Myxococcales bacterium]MDP3212794.1 hypothetical protein [Deltaproteobacteria bacterium]
MAEWQVEWGNESERGYELVMEIMEGDDCRARLELTPDDQLMLTVYPSDVAFQIPASLLLNVIRDGGPPLLASRQMVRKRDGG